MTQERLFKKEYAQELFNVAVSDLETAKALIDADISRKENIFFNIQQAIEKSLKAVLCHNGKAIPLVHELSLIVERLPNSDEVPHADQLYDLTQFATIRRYEEGHFVFTKEEIESSYQMAKSVLDWTRDQIKS